MQHKVLVFVALLIVTLSCVNAEALFSAFAKLTATPTGSETFKSGWVRFDQVSFTDKRVNVTVHVEGTFLDWQYGLLIHQYGDMSNPYGNTLGPVFVGSGSNTPGCPPNPNRREGDLGNWDAVNGVIDGSRVLDVDNALPSLHAPNEIIGLSVALHAGPNQCADGDGGGVSDVMAMGVIGIMNLDNNEAHYDSMTTHSAVASLIPTPACTGCSGTVWFQETAVGVMVVAQVFGLPHLDNPHGNGLSIRWYGDLSGNVDSKVGMPFNPYGRTHALPPVTPRFMGDLGNIKDFSASASSSWYKYETSNIPNVRAIIGRAVVVGTQPDHGTGIGCNPDGNIGAAVTLGVIGVANPDTAASDLPSDVAPGNKYTTLNCTVPNDVSPHADDGKEAALYIGWGLAVLFLGCSIGLIVYYYAKLRGRAGYDEF